MAQAVFPEFDPNEMPAQRHYEFEWANRREPSPPTLTFADLHGWTIATSEGVQAELHASRAENIWSRPVAKLRYKGTGSNEPTPLIELVPPKPVPIEKGSDCVELWVHGNLWEWEGKADTPAVTVGAKMVAADGTEEVAWAHTIRAADWFLARVRLSQPVKAGTVIKTVVIRGGYQTEWREIYLDSFRFLKEELKPLKYAPRPKRNLTLLDGQSPGANTGLTKLPFPTREETILPMHMGGKFTNSVEDIGGAYALSYSGDDANIRYIFHPTLALSGITATLDEGKTWGVMNGANLSKREPGGIGKLKSSKLSGGDTVIADYDDGTSLKLRIWQKSLVVDVINRKEDVVRLGVGKFTGVEQPKAFYIPYILFGGSRPSILMSKVGNRTVFASVFLDWYRSNGWMLEGGQETGADWAQINGGIQYAPKTDGKLNPLYERIFLTISPTFEEVMPVVPNPVGLHAKEASDRLWQESWGPEDYSKEMDRSKTIRAYGIEKLIQCNHEITWRDEGESFTLRTHAAPRRGGDDALRGYVAHQKSLGWFSGLYTNYTDIAPVNEYWDPDFAQRDSDNNLRQGWPRDYALKPLKALELDAMIAPQVKSRFGGTSDYTDVHTAIQPWAYTDFDARVPGAGTFAQTFYAYGELLRNDSRVYDGPIFSEGTYHWMYAGMADGNYALTYGASQATAPLLPVFDLYQIHTKECDMGMAWLSWFCSDMPDWQKPENIDYAVDRFLLNTLAYGHIGYLVEEGNGINRMCRSYYMLQQVQARYGLKKPERIGYWDGEKLVSVSEALANDLPTSKRQMMVEYTGGLTLWLNDSPTESWTVKVGANNVVLPPAGWAAYDKDHGLLSYSALNGPTKADYLKSAAYTFVDGRGKLFKTPEAETEGGLAITPLEGNKLRVIVTNGEGKFTLHRPYGVHGKAIKCQAFSTEGKELEAPTIVGDAKSTTITPTKGGVRYEVSFAG